MSLPLIEKEFVQDLIDRLQVIGPVYWKRMFGCHGVFLQGLMFGLIFENTLYLKVDADSRGYYTKRGLEPFSYERQGKILSLNYYQAPAEALEDITVLKDCCDCAFGAAIRPVCKRKEKNRQKMLP